MEVRDDKPTNFSADLLKIMEENTKPLKESDRNSYDILTELRFKIIKAFRDYTVSKHTPESRIMVLTDKEKGTDLKKLEGGKAITEKEKEELTALRSKYDQKKVKIIKHELEEFLKEDAKKYLPEKSIFESEKKYYKEYVAKLNEKPEEHRAAIEAIKLLKEIYDSLPEKTFTGKKEERFPVRELSKDVELSGTTVRQRRQ